MSTSTLALDGVRTQGVARCRDFLELTRPKILLLELATLIVAAMMAPAADVRLAVLLHAALGTALVAAGAGALNQYLERDLDALMQRTAGRPIPSGRISAGEAAGFGWFISVIGVAYLALSVNLLTAALGLLTWVVYVWIYTPLKLRHPLNTFIGAISGALPVLMGWAAVGGRFGIEAATLFMIVFLWQFPHFMAIAWMYRRDYGRAGMRMLSVVDPTGRRAGRQAVCAASALVPVTLIPAAVSFAGPLYACGVLLIGLGQLCCAGVFLWKLDQRSARRLLKASLIYLPAVLGLLILVPLI